MGEDFFVEVDYQQKSFEGQRICGDIFLFSKVKEENRIVVVLSDGMGHGVKASILATLTATMAVNFTKEHKEPEKTAEIIMKTLPECSDRKMNYSTFTIIDIEQSNKVTILEYDNPECIVLRDRKILKPSDTKTIILNGDANCTKKIRVCTFAPLKGDRILFCTDGITQSGLGTPRFPFGWGVDNVGRFAIDMIKQYPQISARNLSGKILNMAYRNDGFQSKDDSTCGIIYFREPRELLICTGPPYNKEDDILLASEIRDFKGKKIVMGATTGDIISRELNLKIEDVFKFEDPELPPINEMEGIDLFTEGILTLNKVEKILKAYNPNTKLGKGPADEIVKLILESDAIEIIIGTRINIAHQDPHLPVELEIRRTVVNRIAQWLEEKLLKKVVVKYI
ncbi:MAG TPA: SpoIIE family protein phosphatase [Bacteroidales bacterium]|jgi:serine/threonine protein phosphatase PrpC|nr:SpoIIE family protein phosphatase [Bacteroidales bacterium]